ncbi:hypothetical protein PF049_00235 [Erythrobacteraceae bacterium WH01K]|nr:hypothetical protein PF049_00235 [Erythrobacteraceae bacterium WH01K]
MTFQTFTERAADLATLFMRWFRPITFALLTLFFVMGYWFPSAATTWLVMVGTTPDWLAYIITALIIGLAAEKGIRELGDAIKAVKVAPKEMDDL